MLRVPGSETQFPMEITVLLIACIIAWGMRSRRRKTRVDKSGVLFIRAAPTPQFLFWNEIEFIGEAQVCEMVGGLYEGSTTCYVGIRLKESSRSKSTKACADNRRLSEFDVLVTPDSGMTVSEFASYLIHERSRYTNTNNPCDPGQQ